MGESNTAEAVAVDGEIQMGIFDEIAQGVENLDAEAALTTLYELIETKGMNDFRVGGVLAVIQSNSFWKEMGEFDSFRNFIEAHLGMEYRKSLYLINLYEALVEAEVRWEDVSDIGWSKLKELKDIITAENADEWLERARDNTVLQLHELVKSFKAGTLESTDMSSESSTITSMTFKVHTDQKETIQQAVDKAKSEAETEFPGVALEAICINYLTGGKVKSSSLNDMMAKAGIQEVIAMIDLLWPDIEVSMTLPKAMSASESQVEEIVIPETEKMDL